MKSERVEEMKKNFLDRKRKGKTIKEIAEEFKVSTWSVYQALEEIARENGLHRDDLLDAVQKSHEGKKGGTSRKVELVNTEELKKDFLVLTETIEKLIRKMESIVEQEEE